LATAKAPICCAAVLRAQGNYEVQVYGAEIVPPERTMVELHSNFTFEGSKTAVDGVRPDNHALHETLEITQGFTSWFETGFYIFTSYRAGEGYQWVGDHIRPRVRVPESWHWPVNVSLSTELGYERKGIGLCAGICLLFLCLRQSDALQLRDGIPKRCEQRDEVWDAYYIRQHLQIGIRALELIRKEAEAGTLHSRKLRSFTEPAFR